MEVKAPTRLLSLDVFRGITIAGMILVNNPGTWNAIYPPLEHASWHGCTPTDLVFPFFLFIVGVAITYALTKKKEAGENQTKLILGISRRAGMLIFLGLFMAAYPKFDLGVLRFPGVLQRIGLVYLITSILFLKISIKHMAYVGGALLLIYWFLMSFIPVPGVGYPNLEKGTNLAAWFDRIFLSGHMWAFSKIWDPEGLLSTMPAISTAILGILTGNWLRNKKVDEGTKIATLFTYGCIIMLAGYIWSGWFPINKSLWTSSYVLYTGGLAMLFLASCYWLIDVKGIKWWTKPFVVYGMNAITVFFLSGLVAKSMGLYTWMTPDGIEISLKGYLFESMFLSWLDPINASLAWALTYITLWLGLMWILYAKKIFIKV
ncbi:MAG: DUF5009 domain-containing protein [bacterium]